MDWVLRNSHIHSTFSNFGFQHADGYHVNENCNAALENILHNILIEDKYLRTFRRGISFGQNIKKDLIPLLIHAKEDKTIELLVRILVNLTIPIECLLSVEVTSKHDFGRHTIFEINNLLASIKVAFTDPRATKSIIEFLKKNVDSEQKSKLSSEQCTNISNGLLLLRNILHIPEDTKGHVTSHNGSNHAVQSQILWNIFSQGVDKVLITLMTIPDATKWAVTMVQLIALLYKDQHVATLNKLLNLWLESSLSDSSEDNESNTSLRDRGSDDFSRILTSDPTSESSDMGESGKSNDNPNSMTSGWDDSSVMNTSENCNQPFQAPRLCDTGKKDIESKTDNKRAASCSSKVHSEQSRQSAQSNKKTLVSENSDCGYGTQIENQESISTSSNEDEPAKKPVHQKPHNPKQRVNNNKGRSGVTLQDRKRRKIVKRGKSNIINVQGLSHNTPTDDDISHVLKEFTIDFLLKGYNAFVKTLHNQILTNQELEIDTSHFFWLVTYFLKFAAQIELDLSHVSSVLSYDIVSYLTAEGVNLCESFELAIKSDGNNDLKPCMRRLHLLVTAVREFVQALDMYKKKSHICENDRTDLVKLQIKICETEELRSLIVLLLRHYNPKYHSKQYLQDIIVTNHILLLFLDSVMNAPDFNGPTNMLGHIRQFATPDVMYQYGLLLEDYASNGEFVNDCIFTVMHHVGGDLDSLITLFQPKILKAFTSIWKSEFEICDDWSDLIEYVINTFIKKPDTLQCMANNRLNTESYDDDVAFSNPILTPNVQSSHEDNEANVKSKTAYINTSNVTQERWTEDELTSLSWNYMQCSTSSDVFGEVIKLFKEKGITKSRDSVIRQLFQQNFINEVELENLTKGESDQNMKSVQLNKELREGEIKKLCEQIAQDGKSKLLEWVQKVLLETCYAKIYLEKRSLIAQSGYTADNTECKLLNFELFKEKSKDLPVMSPVSYHSLLLKQSVPLVPWNCEQASICKDLKFLQVLDKLGFHMPVDSGKVFIRIPHFWTADFLYDVAGKIAPIDRSTLKFSMNDISYSGFNDTKQRDNLSGDFSEDTIMREAPDHTYQIHKQKHFATMVNFTPMPSSTFNSGMGEVDSQYWLQLIQKSQDYKTSLNLESGLREGDAEAQSDTEMPMNDKVSSLGPLGASPQPGACSSGPASPSLLMPTTTHYNVNLAESEDCNNSVCETASIASDLTRMYVSDEEEKPEVLVRPVVQASTLMGEQSLSDSDNAIARKRPRVQ